MDTCSVENCENECFDAEQNKCILHCEKDENYNQIVIEEFNFALKDLIDREMEREVKIILLNNLHFPLKSFSGNVITKYDKLEEIIFFDCYFYGEEDLFKLKELKLEFDNCHFYENIKDIRSQDLFFHKCKFYKSCELCNQDSRKIVIENCFFMNCEINTINFKGLEFTNKLFLNCNINNLILNNCIFNSDFILIYNDTSNKNNNKIDLLNFDESTFNKKVKIQFHNISEATFYNTKFEDFVDFANTTFENKVSFKDTTFEAGAAFVKCNFNKETVFTYTSFEDKTFFNEAKFLNEINLETATFYRDVDFLKIKTEVANRETARKIKDSFEKQNNIIEANRFYAKEMQKREEELEKEIKDTEKRNLKTFVDYTIFKLHSVSSNHSQDPISPIIWIFSISFFYLTLTQINLQDFSFGNRLYYHLVNFVGIFITLLLYYKRCEISHTCKILYVGILQLSYLKFISDCNYMSIFDTIADKINPFSIMTSKDTITFGLLMFKITIAYLIYQFIVSVRQNTRRK